MITAIFLDFDGTIVSERTKFRSGDPACIGWLNQLIDETGAKIVVTSTWRIGKDGPDLPYVQNLLRGWGVTGDVIGVTPDLSPRARGYEIDRFLLRHNEHIENFVILDDDRDMAHLSVFLVACETEFGLQEEQYKVARRLLLHGIHAARGVI